jgi:hypothetical protein
MLDLLGCCLGIGSLCVHVVYDGGRLSLLKLAGCFHHNRPRRQPSALLHPAVLFHGFMTNTAADCTLLSCSPLQQLRAFATQMVHE